VAETPQIPVDSKCSYILEVRTIKELVMSPSIIQELFIISQIALATILPPLLSPLATTPYSILATQKVSFFLGVPSYAATSSAPVPAITIGHG